MSKQSVAKVIVSLFMVFIVAGCQEPIAAEQYSKADVDKKARVTDKKTPLKKDDL